MTLFCTQAPFIYGNWINGTGTTHSASGSFTFSGRGSQTITSSGKTFTQGIVVNTLSGSVSCLDSFTTSQGLESITLTSGTFNTNNYAMTAVKWNLSGLAVRTLNIGSSLCVSSDGGTAWSATTSTNLTVTGTGTISLTSASAKTFAGGGLAYTDITLNQGGAGTLTISGNNTFKDITNTYKATGATIIAMGTTTQRVSQWTAAGESGRVLTVQGTSASSPATLVLTGATKPNVDYLTATGIRAYNLTDTWYVGANSTNNGSLGLLFEAAPAPPAPGGAGNFFLIFV
jgi:N-acetylmuramoyl-L-alanine amidase CwlA